MSFIDEIKNEIRSPYIIGLLQKNNGNAYFEDLRGAAGERIEGFDGKPINQKVTINNCDLAEGEYYQFDWDITGNSSQNYSFKCKGNIQPVDKKAMLDVRLKEKLEQHGTNRKDANQNEEMINREVSGAPHTYIYELLQNSNDYPLKDNNNNKIPVYVKFILTEHYLLLQHSGAPFNLPNIAAICTVNEGEKRENVETIGYKGMGFKSVFVKNDYVYLQSGGWSLRFDEKYINTEGRFKRNWQYMPISTKTSELEEEVKDELAKMPKCMNVFFALRHRHNANENIPNLTKVFSDDQILVFIPHVFHVEVIIKGQTVFDVYKDVNIWITKDYSIKVDDEYKSILDKDIKSGNKIPEKFQKIKEITISFAIKHEGKNIIPLENAKIYNYLPTEQTLYIPFLLNADFVPDAARKGLPELDWNKKIIEDAGEHFALWWSTLLKEENKYNINSVFDLVPNFNSGDIFRNKFIEGFKRKIQTIECIPVFRDGKYKLVTIENTIKDSTGLTNSKDVIISDNDFYTIWNNSSSLPHPKIRNHKNLWILLNEFAKDRNTITFDTITSLIIENKSEFNEWVKDIENNIRFISFLFDSDKINYVLNKVSDFFLTDTGSLQSPQDMYLNIDTYLDDLEMFKDLLPRLNKEVRNKLEDKIISITKLFKPFNAVTTANNIIEDFEKNGYEKRINNLTNSVKFIHFLATARDNNSIFSKELPSTYPFYDENCISITGTNTLYQKDKFGECFKKHTWIKEEWINFLNEKYFSNDSTIVSNFLIVQKKPFITPEIVWNNFITNKNSATWIKEHIDDIEKSKEFYLYISKNIYPKGFCFNSLTKSEYSVFGNDGHKNYRVALSNSIYWDDDTRNEFVKESWLPEKSCWAISNDYFTEEQPEDNKTFRKFFTSSNLVSEFSYKGFFNSCIKNIWIDIINKITTKEISYDFLKFIYDHHIEIEKVYDSALTCQIPVAITGEEELTSLDKLEKEDTVFQPSEDLCILKDEIWMKEKSILMLDSYYENLFEGKKEIEYFDKVGFKFFNKIDYIQKAILPNIEDFKKVLENKTTNVAFHKYFAQNYTKFSSENFEDLKKAPIFITSPNNEEGVLKDSLTQHFLPSNKLTELISLDIIPLNILESIHPDYISEDSDYEYFKHLDHKSIKDSDFLLYISEKNEIKEYIKDKERNILFWKWVCDFELSSEDIYKLKGFPILVKKPKGEEETVSQYSNIYVPSEYTGNKDTSKLISRFIPNPMFVSTSYIDNDIYRDWKSLFIKLGLNVTTWHIVKTQIIPNLANYKEEFVVYALAEHCSKILKLIDTDENFCKQLESLNLYCLDKNYHNIKETIVSGKYVNIEVNCYPDVIVKNMVHDCYLDHCKDNQNLYDNVINLIVSLADKFKRTRKNANSYLKTKIKYFIDNQNEYIESVSHYKIIAELAKDYKEQKDDDTFIKIFKNKAIYLKCANGNKCKFVKNENGITSAYCNGSDDNVQGNKLVYLSSKYNPACDFIKYGVKSMNFISESYLDYCKLEDLKLFFIQYLGIMQDFSKDTLSALENESFSRYFWTDFLQCRIKLYDINKFPFYNILNEDNIGHRKCIPTKYGMKEPKNLYDSRLKDISEMVELIGKKDILTPDIKIPNGYLIGMKDRLDFEDCLAYLKLERPYYREKVYEWITETPADKVAALKQKGIVKRFYEEATWYCGTKKWVPLKNLVALEWADGKSILKDHFSGNECVISKMPQTKVVYEKLCDILEIPIITNDDFDFNYKGTTITDHEAIREIDKRIMYLAFHSSPNDWKDVYKDANLQLSKSDIKKCQQIFFFCTCKENLKDRLQCYSEDPNTLWYVGNWNSSMFGNVLNWVIKKFKFCDKYDYGYVENLFVTPFNEFLKEYEAGKLPEDFINQLSEKDREGLNIEMEMTNQANENTPQMTWDDVENEENAKDENRPDNKAEKEDVKKESHENNSAGDSKNNFEDNSENIAKNEDKRNDSLNEETPDNNAKIKEEHNDDENSSLAEKSQKRWEEEAKRKPTLPKSSQPLQKTEDETYDSEENNNNEPEYGEVYDKSNSHKQHSKEAYKSSNVEKECKEAEKHLKNAQEKKDRRELLKDSTPYSLEWFNYRLDIILEGEKESYSHDIKLEFFDWIKIDEENNIYRLVTSSGYIPQNFSEYINQIIYVIDNGKRTRINGRVIESDESGIDLKCEENLVQSNTGIKIYITATSCGNFIEHMVTRFRQLNYNIGMGTILNNILPKDISFIYGPPGTGKTREVVCQISKAIKDNSRMNILVLTPTNRAADEVAERLCDDIFVEEYLSRYGITESQDLVCNHFNVLKNRQNMYLHPKKNVVVTTIARYPYDTMLIGKNTQYIFDLEWDLIIVDEASMIDIIPMTLMLVNKKAKKYIIAGDPKQIRPVTTSGIEDKNIYDMVELNSFAKAKDEYTKYPVKLLDMQHRSVPEIGNIVSRFCYDGLLNNDINREKQKPLKISNIDVNTINTIGFNVENFSLLYGWNKVEMSAVHVYSAIFAYEFASYIAKELHNNCPEYDYTIGIVCPYGKQAESIKQMIEQCSIDTNNCKIKCGTAHKFQGGECDIMIVVMNYPSYEANIEANVNNENIINVCMSRARDYLFFLMPEKKKNDSSKYIMNQNIGTVLPEGTKQYHAFDLENAMFGDKLYIAKNSSLRCHMPINVTSGTLKKYEVRLSETALDIQIRNDK